MTGTRMTTWGLGGYDTTLPYDNLAYVTDTDAVTGEKFVYYPPDIPPPPDPPEVEPTQEETAARLTEQVEDLKKAVAALQKQVKNGK